MLDANLANLLAVKINIPRQSHRRTKTVDYARLYAHVHVCARNVRL